MQARPQVPGLDHNPVAGRDAAHHFAAEGLRTGAGGPAELGGQGGRGVGAGIRAHPRAVPGGGHAPRGPHAVEPAADDPDRPGLLRRERAGGHRGDGAGSQRRHRAGVEQHQRLARGGIREADDAGDGRQPPFRVTGKRGDPLQQGEPVAADRHRPEVSERRALEVDLGRHHPLAGVVAQERRAHPLDRQLRRHRGQHRVVIEDRKLGHSGGRYVSLAPA